MRSTESQCTILILSIVKGFAMFNNVQILKLTWTRQKCIDNPLQPLIWVEIFLSESGFHRENEKDGRIKSINHHNQVYKWIRFKYEK